MMLMMMILKINHVDKDEIRKDKEENKEIEYMMMIVIIEMIINMNVLEMRDVELNNAQHVEYLYYDHIPN